MSSIQPGAIATSHNERPERGRSVTVIALAGEHDVSTTGDIWVELGRAIAHETSDVVVDMRAVTFIDAAVIGVLARGRALLAGQSRTLRFRSPSPTSRRLLVVCGMLDDIDGDESELNGQLGDARSWALSPVPALVIEPSTSPDDLEPPAELQP